LQPQANVDGAIAEVRLKRSLTVKLSRPASLAPGHRYDASTVPILQLGRSGKGIVRAAVNDLGVTSFRRSSPRSRSRRTHPLCGKVARSWLTSIRSNSRKGLSATDVVSAVNAQNVILPSGTAKIGPTEYNVGSEWNSRLR